MSSIVSETRPGSQTSNIVGFSALGTGSASTRCFSVSGGFEGPSGAPRNINRKSIRHSGCVKHEVPDKYQSFRLKKYELQNVIQKAYLAGSGIDTANPDWGEYNGLPSVVKCRRTRVSHEVTINRKKGRKRAYYGGLAVCGSVWSCPLCCHAVMEVRRREIVQLFDWAYGSGLKVVMVTFTFPHYDYQSCGDLLGRQKRAFEKLRRRRDYGDLKQSCGFRGLVRSLEVTRGANGWHPHTHELFVVDRSADADLLKSVLLKGWEVSCSNVGLIPRGKLRAFRRQAVDVRDNMNSSSYLAKADSEDKSKWGGDREVTGFHLKDGRHGALSPFQLAAAHGDGVTGAWDLFKEYADAFKGRAAVFWSSRLKDLAGVHDMEDSQAAEEGSPADDEFMSLPPSAWDFVKSKEHRGAALTVYENGGMPAVAEWLRSHGYSQVWQAYIADEAKAYRLARDGGLGARSYG